MPAEGIQREVEVTRPARYLLSRPPETGGRTLLVLALHGYGMRPDVMLRLTKGLFHAQHVIASLEGPNSFFLSGPGPDGRIGYNWGTPETTDFHWRVHHEILLSLIPRLQQESGIGPERTLIVGFSQPVGMNYRFAATHNGLVRGVIGICGGVPRNWDDGPYRDVDAALLHIARDDDEFFPLETVSRFEDRLRRRAPDVEFHLIPGKHRFPSGAAHLVESWLDRILSRGA